MNKTKRKERERKAREEIILDAAEQVFQENGYNGATMDEVADLAGVGKGTLYLHFKSKQSIYLAICLRGSQLLNEQMKKVLLSNNKGYQMVENIGKTYLNFIKENPIYHSAFNFYDSQQQKGNISDEDIFQLCQSNKEDAINCIVRALQIGIQDGSIRKDINPYQLSLIVWGASKGIVLLALKNEVMSEMKEKNGVRCDLQSLFENFIQIMSGGIKNDPQSKKI